MVAKMLIENNSTALFRVYQTKISNPGLTNIGLVISVFLVLLLIFRELYGSLFEEKRNSSPGADPGAYSKKYRFLVGSLTVLLIIIFAGIIFNKIYMAIGILK